MTSAPTAPSLPFPHPVLTPITDGPPTLVSIKTLQRQLYANAKSIPTTLGGGANGYLALVMPDADYLARTGVAFPAPPHPGDQPIHAAAATAAQITEANRQYDRQLTVHSAYITVKEELKRMILLAVPDIYLNTISDATFGYADITPQRLLTHLVDTYATVDEDDIENNRKTLEAPWNPDDPIETLWTRILNAQQYATAAAEPIPVNLLDPTTRHPHQMAPSTSCAKSCARSCRVPPRPNSAPFFTTPKKAVHSALPSRKWATPSASNSITNGQQHSLRHRQ